jgi:hypothetical protein
MDEGWAQKVAANRKKERWENRASIVSHAKPLGLEPAERTVDDRLEFQWINPRDAR